MAAGSASSPVLDIQLFGRFSVNINGEVVGERRWERRAAKALIKLLALSPPYSLHREQVVDLLWPDQSPATGINSLNKAIHSARRALEPGLTKGAESRFILTPKNQIILASPGGLRVDVQSFEQAAHQAMRDRDAPAAQAALALYGGALLVDDLYEEWTLARRDVMQLLFRSTALFAARLFAQQAEPAKAIETAQRLILQDPADEPVHQLLIHLYAASGQRDLALRQFELGKRALGALGLVPTPETVELAEATRQGRQAAPWATDTPAPSPAPSPAQTADEAWLPQVVPLSFHSGLVRRARMSPDGRWAMVVATRDDGVTKLYRLAMDTGAIEQVGEPDTELFAISPRGDLAVGLDRRRRNPLVHLSTLTILSADGGPPMTVLPDVQWADWHPRSATVPAAALPGCLATVRDVQGRTVLEFPIGTVRFRSVGWLSHLRCSPDGRYLALLEHPIYNDDEGDVLIVDLESHDAPPRVLARGFLSVQGLAWIGHELWFTALRRGSARSLYVVGLQGSEQLMHQGPGSLLLHDSGPSRQLLVSAEITTIGAMARHASDPAERDISWHEHTFVRDISADGRMLLVEESYSAGRHRYLAYLRGIDGTWTRQIARGVPLAMAPDQRTVILRSPSKDSRLSVLDSVSGLTRHLVNDVAQPVVHNEFVSFFPHGQRIAFSATASGGGLHVYLQDLTGGPPVCFTPDVPGVRMPWNRAVSPDGQTLILLSPDNRVCLYPLRGGDAIPVGDLDDTFRVLAWHDDGRSVFVQRFETGAATVYRCVLASGVLSEWLDVAPSAADPKYVVRRVCITTDGRSYAYSISKSRSDLYLFEDG